MPRRSIIAAILLLLLAAGGLYFFNPPELPRVILHPVLNFWVVSGILLALLAVMILFGPSKEKTTWRQRGVLTSLRFGAIVLLFLVMLRPSYIQTQIQEQTATLILMFDTSRSMQISNRTGTQSRWQELVDLIGANKEGIQSLEEDLEVKTYTFDTGPAPAEWNGGQLKLPEEATGDETAIGASLREVLRQEAHKRILAVLMFSDGAQRANPQRDIPPAEPARELHHDQGANIFTFGFGASARQIDDVAVEDLQVNPTVFVKNTLTVVGNIRAVGFADKQIPVELLFETSPGNMEVVDTATVRPSAADGQVKVELDYIPQTPGEYKVTLRAVPQPGELLETNNELSSYVTVLRGGINVLYLEGAPRHEMTFLYRTVGGWENIHLDLKEIDAQATDPFPPAASEWFQPGKYDVFIIGDLDSQAFPQKIAKALAGRVEAGAGLMFLGGFHSFRPGGYQIEPFESLLPIDMNIKDAKLERQGFGEPIRKDLHLIGKQQMFPTETGERHFIMLLGPRDRNKAIWQELPPLVGANKFHGVKPLSQVLAENQDGRPLLVAHEAKQGRVLAFAGDSTWRWRMKGHVNEHKRFWRQLMLWLARKEATSESGVWIKLAGRSFTPGARVEVRTGAETPEGEPIADAVFLAEVAHPDGQTESVSLSRDGIDRVGSFFNTQEPGEYNLTVTASQGGELIGTASARFLVHAHDLELDDPRADRATLNELAAVTEGEHLPPESLPDLLKKLKQSKALSPLEMETKIDLYDNWIVLLLFVGFLATEWYLRKRWLLV